MNALIWVRSSDRVTAEAPRKFLERIKEAKELLLFIRDKTPIGETRVSPIGYHEFWLMTLHDQDFKLAVADSWELFRHTETCSSRLHEIFGTDNSALLHGHRTATNGLPRATSLKSRRK